MHKQLPEAEVLHKYQSVAIVGISPDKERDSNKVGRYLSEHGYHVISVNPNANTIIGRKSYPDLHSIPYEVEIVDIFRKSEEVLPIVEEAIGIGAKVVWMQEGVINQQAAALAKKAGLKVIMNRCMKKTHESLNK